MKRPVAAESASDLIDAPAFIDAKINQLADWRGKTLAKVRAIIHKADPGIVEEVKWMGTPIFSHGGIVCTGETYKSVVKMTFAKGATLKALPASSTRASRGTCGAPSTSTRARRSTRKRSRRSSAPP